MSNESVSESGARSIPDSEAAAAVQEPKQRAEAAEQRKVFISHKHDDSALADTLASWIRRNTAGTVNMFQSSSPWRDAPRVGRALTRELRRAVAEAHVVVLVYTIPDKDWNYCMWEVGIASDPSSPEARIVVLQCGQSVPTLFTDQVRVDARNETSIRQFSSQLFTDNDFFPGFSSAATKYTADGQDIRDAADDLFSKLTPYILDESRTWAARPYMKLALSREGRNKLKQAEAPSDIAEIARTAQVLEQDLAFDRIFGLANKPGVTLGNLVLTWLAEHRDVKSEPSNECPWFTDLSLQIANASNSRLLTGPLVWMKGRSAVEEYAAVVAKVSDAGVTTEIEVYFCERRP